MLYGGLDRIHVEVTLLWILLLIPLLIAFFEVTRDSSDEHTGKGLGAV